MLKGLKQSKEGMNSILNSILNSTLNFEELILDLKNKHPELQQIYIDFLEVIMKFEAKNPIQKNWIFAFFYCFFIFGFEINEAIYPKNIAAEIPTVQQL